MDLGIGGNGALVPAASSGLGKASATALAREGADVVINGRDEARLAAAVEEVRQSARGEVIGHKADLTKPGDIDSLVEGAVSEFGRLDHLVTSAGGRPAEYFQEMDDEDWYEAFDLLVMSLVRTVRVAAEPLQADSGGTIVTITSKAVREASDALVLSNSVRMSVIGLEKTLSTELAPEVRANAVLPESHETRRIEASIEDAVERGTVDSYQDGLDARGDRTPLGRIGDPMELGDAVAFLSSPRSGYINGVALPLDGGASASNL